MWRSALSKQQTGGNDVIKRRCQFLLRRAYHRSQQRMRELTPDRRSDLRHILGGAEPV